MSQLQKYKGAGMTDQATRRKKSDTVVGSKQSRTKKILLTPKKFGELVRETEETIEKIEESLKVHPERLKSRITI